MSPDELAELEHAERDSRFRALYEPTNWNRRQAANLEVETYRAELGDDNDD